MSTVTLHHESTAAPQAIAATVMGGDEPTRHRASRLLAEAGFSVTHAWEASAASPAFALLLLIQGTDAERVAQLRAVGRDLPEARILAVMPAGAPNASLRRVLLAGATGIVSDDDLETTLVATARATLAGQLTVPIALSRQIAPRPLSHREKEILALVTLGQTNREIAQTLFLAESTVKTHLSSAFRKLDTRSRSEAVTRVLDPENGYSATIREIADAAFRPAR
jgi:two-component system NarL family response regulator